VKLLFLLGPGLSILVVMYLDVYVFHRQWKEKPKASSDGAQGVHQSSAAQEPGARTRATQGK
jgi:hypothetical protein